LHIERQPFTADASGFFGGNGKCKNRAVDFGAGGADRLSGFERNAAGKLLAALD